MGVLNGTRPKESEKRYLCLLGRLRALADKQEQLQRPGLLERALGNSPDALAAHLKAEARKQRAKQIVKIQEEADQIGNEIDALRAQDAALPPIEMDDSLQLGLLRGRLREQRDAAALMEDLTGRSSGPIQEVRRAKLAETKADIRHLTSKIHAVEARRRAARDAEDAG